EQPGPVLAETRQERRLASRAPPERFGCQLADDRLPPAETPGQVRDEVRGESGEGLVGKPTIRFGRDDQRAPFVAAPPSDVPPAAEQWSVARLFLTQSRCSMPIPGRKPTLPQTQPAGRICSTARLDRRSVAPDATLRGGDDPSSSRRRSVERAAAPATRPRTSTALARTHRDAASSDRRTHRDRPNARLDGQSVPPADRVPAAPCLQLGRSRHLGNMWPVTSAHHVDTGERRAIRRRRPP